MAGQLDVLKKQYQEGVIAIVKGIIDPDGFSNEVIRTDVSLFSEGLGMDSIDIVECVTQIEENFHVRIADYSKLKTIDDIVNYLIFLKSNASL